MNNLSALYSSRDRAAFLEKSAKRGLADQAEEHRRELAEHAADVAAILGWLRELGADPLAIRDAAGALHTAVVNLDHSLCVAIDDAGDYADAGDFSELGHLAEGR